MKYSGWSISFWTAGFAVLLLETITVLYAKGIVSLFGKTLFEVNPTWPLGVLPGLITSLILLMIGGVAHYYHTRA